MVVRRRMSADARRDHLLDACAAIVDRDGFPAVTIDQVAADCGVTRTVVYQQFGGRNEMLDALIDRSVRRGARTLATATADAVAARDLRDAMAFVLAAVDADPASWRMFLVAPTVVPRALEERLATARALVRDLSTSVIREASADSDPDPELTARMLQAMTEELIRLHLSDPAEFTTERILTQVDRINRTIALDHRPAPDDGSADRPATRR
jgi:AcrR family transcriptional regulator